MSPAARGGTETDPGNSVPRSETSGRLFVEGQRLACRALSLTLTTELSVPELEKDVRGVGGGVGAAEGREGPRRSGPRGCAPSPRPPYKLTGGTRGPGSAATPKPALGCGGRSVRVCTLGLTGSSRRNERHRSGNTGSPGAAEQGGRTSELQSLSGSSSVQASSTVDPKRIPGIPRTRAPPSVLHGQARS